MSQSPDLKNLNLSLSRNSSGVSAVKPNEVKREYQLQQWGMVRGQKDSVLTVRQWRADKGDILCKNKLKIGKKAGNIVDGRRERC